MQKNPTHQLDIKRPQSKRSLRSLTAICKGFWQQVFKAFTALLYALLEGDSFGFDSIVIKSGKFRLQRIDPGDQRPRRFDHTVIRRAKNFSCK